MNRLLSILLVSLITITGFVMYRHHDLGTLSIAFADFRLQTNFLVAGAALLCLLFIVFALLRAVQYVISGFDRLRQHHRQRQQRRADKTFVEGMLAILQNDFQTALNLLSKPSACNRYPLLNTLFAAQAAQHNGALEQRDLLLQQAFHLAEDQPPAYENALCLIQANMLLQSRQTEQALAILQQRHRQQPGNAAIITPLADACISVEDWPCLESLLPELKKKTGKAQLHRYQSKLLLGRMKQARQQGDVDRLQSLWQDADKSLRQDPAMLETYVRHLIEMDCSGEAEKVLRQALNQNWSDACMQCYAELDVKVDNKALETVESWLPAHPENPWLLLALGKHCIQLCLWGKARNYLEASLSLHPMAETYLRLARLLEEHMHETGAAMEYYRQGLHLLAGRYNETILDTAPDNALGKPAVAAPPRLTVIKN